MHRINAPTPEGAGLFSPGHPLHWKMLAVPVLMSVVLLFTWSTSFLLFHTLAELFSVAVGILMFVVAWNTRAFIQNDFLLFLGTGYLLVAILDASHAMAYKGMPFFDIHDPNPGLHFWIYARSTETLLLLTAPLFLNRRLNGRLALFLFCLAGVVLSWLALDFKAPTFYIEGEGLTPLKVGIEYSIIALQVVAIVIYLRLRTTLTPKVAQFMVTAMFLTIAAEMSFTLYVDVYGVLNVIGHTFKLFSFWMIYQAIVHTMLREPFALMSREAGTYDAIPYPAALVDADGLIAQANQAATRLIGKPVSEVIGQSAHQFLHPHNLSEEECELCQRLRQGVHMPAKGFFYPQQQAWQLVSLSPMNQSGIAVGMVQVSVDITDRMAAEEALQESQELLSTIINGTPDWVFIKDRDFRYLYVNQGYANAVGMQPDDIVGKLDDELGFPMELIYGNAAKGIRGYRADDIAVLAGKELRNTYDPATDAAGNLVILDTLKTPLRNSKGEIYGLLGFAHDVTQRLDLEQKLHQAATVFDSTSEGIMMTDAEGNIVTVNAAFSEITGYSADEVIGQNARMLRSGKHDREFYQSMWQALTRSGKWQGELWNRNKNGELYPEWITISAVNDERGEPASYVAAFSDISPLKRTEAALEHMAQHDSLTGLPNRVLLIARLESAIQHALRNDTRAAMLFLDLDNFKHINDSLGHLVGDDVLKVVADTLRSTVRQEDMVARQGGDEFMVVLEGINAPEEAGEVALKILEALRPPIDVDGHSFYVGASIGITLCPEDGTAPDVLIRNADTAMYQAKDAGRDTYRFFTAELNIQAARRLAVESGLRHAVQHNEIQVYFQPKIDSRNDSLVGAEALARWHSPDLGWVPPDEFIHVAESIGLIDSLGEYILDQSMRQAARWRTELHRDLKIAVNVSSRQFDNPGLVGRIEDMLQRHQLPAEQLEIEITERLLLRRDDQIKGMLFDLEKLGINIALDDFGTGYSSLAYVKHFPIDILKIDRSFVHDMVTDMDDAILIKAIIAMAHGLGMQVVAEGVETAEQIRFLKAEQCDLLQGYFYSPALPADDFEKLIIGWDKRPQAV